MGSAVFFSARIEYPSVVEMFSVEAGFRNGSTESEDFFLQVSSVRYLIDVDMGFTF